MVKSPKHETFATERDMPQKYFTVTGCCQRCPNNATSQVEAIGMKTEKLCARCADAWWDAWYRRNAMPSPKAVA